MKYVRYVTYQCTVEVKEWRYRKVRGPVGSRYAYGIGTPTAPPPQPSRADRGRQPGEAGRQQENRERAAEDRHAQWKNETRWQHALLRKPAWREARDAREGGPVASRMGVGAPSTGDALSQQLRGARGRSAEGKRRPRKERRGNEAPDHTRRQHRHGRRTRTSQTPGQHKRAQQPDVR